MNTQKIVLIIVALLTSAASAHAGSITMPFTGCVNISELNGPLVVYITGPAEHRAAAFQGDKAGCEPTTHHQRELLIDGGTDALKHMDVGEVVAVEFDYAHWDQCGRFQLDFKNMSTGEFWALMIDTGRDFVGTTCNGVETQPKPPIVVKPPVITPHVPPIVIEPHMPDEPTPVPVPEPATVFMLGSGLLVAARRLRK